MDLQTFIYKENLQTSPRSLRTYLTSLSPYVPIHLNDPQRLWTRSFMNPLQVQATPHGAFHTGPTPQFAQAEVSQEMQHSFSELQATRARHDNTNPKHVMPRSTPTTSKTTGLGTRTRHRKLKPKKLFGSPSKVSPFAETSEVKNIARSGKNEQKIKREVSIQETIDAGETETAISHLMTRLSSPSFFGQVSATSKEPQENFSSTSSFNETPTETLETCPINNFIKKSFLSSMNLNVWTIGQRDGQKSHKCLSPSGLPNPIQSSPSVPCEDVNKGERYFSIDQVKESCGPTKTYNPAEKHPPITNSRSKQPGNHDGETRTYRRQLPETVLKSRNMKYEHE